MDAIIMCRSITQAQQAAKSLYTAGFSAKMIRPPRSLNREGCAFAVAMDDVQLPEAVRHLKYNAIGFGKVYVRKPSGIYEEKNI